MTATKTKKKPATKTKRTPKAKAEPKAKKTSALDAAVKMLKESGEPMTTKQMVDAMAKKNYWASPNGATPHATLYSVRSRARSTPRGRKPASRGLSAGSSCWPSGQARHVAHHEAPRRGLWSLVARLFDQFPGSPHGANVAITSPTLGLGLAQPFGP